MKFWKLVVGGPTVLAVLIFMGPVSCTKEAKHDHSAHGHAGHSAPSDHSATPAAAARSYADAARQIQTHMTSLDAIIKSGEHDAVHKDSVAIGQLCDSLGELAAAQGSPVPKDRVKEVTESAKQLSAASRSFHKAAHADDLPQIKADYAQMGKLVASLARYAQTPGAEHSPHLPGAHHGPAGAGASQHSGHEGYQAPPDEPPEVPPLDAKAAKVAEGYRVDVVLSGLTYPTSVDFDDAGNMYVAEAGGVYGDPVAPARIWRVSPKGEMRVVADRLSSPVNDLLWHNGRLYISHGGRISQLEDSGVRDLVTGLPSKGDHHNNQLTVGPKGKIYFGQGTVTNSGVVGMDSFEFGWLKQHPDLCDVPARDVHLAAQEFQTPNVLNLKRVEAAKTSAFHPFGKSAAGEATVPGNAKANGAILRMNPDGSNLEAYAWGLRNPYGVMWGPDKRLYVSNNSYDERGSRPIANAPEELYIVRQGAWCGWPDFAAGIPVTDPRYKSDRGPAPQFLMRDHPPVEKPWLTFPKHSSITKIDFSPGKAFGHEGQLFVAFFGHMTPVTGTIEKEYGHRVVRIDVKTGAVESFFGGVEHNGGHQQAQGHEGHGGANGPTTGHGQGNPEAHDQQTDHSAARGHAGHQQPDQQAGGQDDKMLHDVSPGPRRLVDVRFSPDGNALYVADFGVMVMSETGPRPIPETGVIWRITREGTTVRTPPAGLSIMPSGGPGQPMSPSSGSGQQGGQQHQH